MSSNSTVPVGFSMDSNGNMNNMGEMHAYLFLSPDFYVLFQKLRVDSDTDLVFAFFGTLILAAIIAVLNRKLKLISRDHQSGSLCGKFISFIATSIDTLLHYSLMLIAMTFNVYIILALSLGHGMGHLVNVWLESRLQSSSAEAKSDSVTDIESNGSSCHS